MKYWFVAGACALGTLVAIFCTPVWPGEVMHSLLPQIGAGALLLSLPLFFLGKRGSGLLIAASAILAFVVAKEAFVWRDSSEADPVLKIVWANVFTKPDSFSAVMQLAREENADLVLIAETPRRLGLDSLRQDYAEYPFIRGAAAGENAAITALSKKPIGSFTVLPVRGRKSILFNMPVDGAAFSIAAVHPTIPSSPARTKSRNDHLLTTAAALKAKTRKIMIGDFNTVPWSPTLARAEKSAGVKRAAPSKPSTWMSDFPVFGLPIDHVLTGEGVSAAVRVGPQTGSDHYPLIVSISINDGAAKPH